MCLPPLSSQRLSKEPIKPIPVYYTYVHVSHHQILLPFSVLLHPSSALLELAYPLIKQIKNTTNCEPC